MISVHSSSPLPRSDPQSCPGFGIRRGQVVLEHGGAVPVASRLHPAAAQGGALPVPGVPPRRPGGGVHRRRCAEGLLQVRIRLRFCNYVVY